MNLRAEVGNMGKNWRKETKEGNFVKLVLTYEITKK